MGELLNRKYQLEILNAMAESYPAVSKIVDTFGNQENNSLKVNLAYLNEHGLIECKSYQTHDDPYPLPTIGKITAAGLDFLTDDGGLSAILGVVTVRFDDETLRALLIERIEEENEDPGVKSRMTEVVKSMPAAAIKAIGDKAIDLGIAAVSSLLETH